MRALLLAALLALPAGLAQGTDASFRAATTGCEPLGLVGVAPPSFCPRVQSDGVAQGLGCAGASCDVRVAGTAQGHGLPVGTRVLTLEAQLQGDPFATPACESETTAADAICEGFADFSFPLADGACASFVVRARLAELGEGSVWAYSLSAEVQLTACRAGDALDVSRA